MTIPARRWLAALCVAVSAQAAPPAKPATADVPMTVAARQAWRDGLRDGRKAHHAKDFARAIEGFDRALAAFPDDPRALAERAWARFQAGDLAGAEADARRALARTSDRRLRGATLYNLGRIHEAQGKTDAARDAWQQSLAQRPSEAVRARLGQLAALGPLAARPFLGPFADADAVCAAIRASGAMGARQRCVREAVTSPIDQAFGGQARLVAAMEPVAEEDTPRPGPGAAYIEGGVDDTPGEATYHLTVATPAGTWLLTDVASRYNPGAFGISEDISFDGARAQTLRDGRVVWHLGVTVNRHDSDMGLNEVEDWTIQTALLCSTGPSGRPSCIGPLSTRVEATRESLGLDEPAEGAQGEHDFWKKASSLDLSLADTGELTIKIVQGKDMDAAMKALKGTHKIAFP